MEGERDLVHAVRVLLVVAEVDRGRLALLRALGGGSLRDGPHTHLGEIPPWRTGLVLCKYAFARPARARPESFLGRSAPDLKPGRRLRLKTLEEGGTVGQDSSGEVAAHRLV